MKRLLDQHRLLGVVFVAMMCLGVWTVNGIFTQRFTDFDRVKLTAGTLGLNLPARADVKARGVIVGQVLETTPRGAGVELVLGLDPDRIGQLPANVGAAIVPKTLFGEKYVDLTLPATASKRALRAGDRIEEAEIPIEVERVLNDLYPLLRAVQPAELSYTLNALADALEGRGEELGESLVTLDGYLRRLNPQLPALIADLKLLAATTDTYAEVMPQLAATLRNSVKTGNTLVSREAKLNAFLKDLTAFSDTATGFLDKNGDNIVRLGKLSEPTLALLRRYAPEYPCLLEGIVKQAPRLGSTFRGFTFHIDLIVLPKQPRGYGAQEVPIYAADNGPNCAQLPSPPIPYRDSPNIADGVDGLQRGDAQRTAPGFGQREKPANLTVATSGTAAQQALINSLTAPAMGISADATEDLTTLLFAPAMAGTEVRLR